MKQRQIGRHVSEQRKEKIIDEAGGICEYCRDSSATQVDHIIPWSHTHDDRNENLAASCQLCNLIAGSKVFPMMDAKREWILKRREKMLRRPIAIWTRKDYSELGPAMKSEIRKNAILVSGENVAQQLTDMLVSEGRKVIH